MESDESRLFQELQASQFNQNLIHVNELVVLQIAKVRNLYRHDILSLDQTLNLIRKLSTQGMTAQLQMEKDLKTKRYDQIGFDCLTTDTQGARPIKWFIKTGRGFTTSVARNCFSYVIFHPKIGMSTAHYNSVTSEAIVETYRKLLVENFQMPSDGKDRYNAMVSDKILFETIEKTMNAASAEFKKLSGRTLPTQVNMCGLENLADNRIDLVMEYIETHTDKMFSNFRDLEFDPTGMITPGEVLWEGPKKTRAPYFMPNF